MDYAKLRSYRHADPVKVVQVWDALGTSKNQRVIVPSDKLVKSLRKKLNLKDDQIRLLLDEIEGDGLIEKVDPSTGKASLVGYRFSDFSQPCVRGKHDWYCFQCHKPGEVLKCSDCFRVYHVDCAREASKLSSPSGRTLKSPTLADSLFEDFSCAVCESRPKCEFSRKQIRKLLEFATHHLRKQSLWKTFLRIGYSNEINKNEFLVYKYSDLDLLQRKIKDGRYAALEEFAMDVQLLVHNVCILHGPYSSQADEIRFFLRSVNSEIYEAQLCTDCYINAKTRLTDWISKPCKPPHELIWARNRTSIGAGMFNDAVIWKYYWPAKVLLERDDAYEIRFFGGTHERALVKKSNTRPFHIPADELGVLRRNNATGNLSGGGFERAWNEVSKLQANIDTGYYTHSSGESDLPPSDDEYSDEVYLGPRRSVPLRTNRTESPRSSATSTNVKIKRRRHGSSSSQQTSTTSATPTNDAPSPVLPSRVPPVINRTYDSHALEHGSKLNGQKRKYTPRLTMPTVQPGTPGAAAISALAETKAAMAAAVGEHRISGTLTTDLLKLTARYDRTNLSPPSGSRKLSGVKPGRGRRGPGRPRRGDAKAPRSSSRPLHSPSSPSASRTSSPLSSDSELNGEDAPRVRALSSASGDSDRNWNPKGNQPMKWKTGRQSRGRHKSRIGVRAANAQSHSAGFSSDGEEVTDRWTSLVERRTTKPIRSPTRGRGLGSKITTATDRLASSLNQTTKPTKRAGLNSSGGKRGRRSSKNLNTNLDAHRDEDDELTDRCGSPSLPVDHLERASRGQKSHRRHSSQQQSSVLTQLSPSRKTAVETVHIKPSPSKRVGTPKRRSSPSSNFSSYSSPSTSDADSDSGFANRRLAGKSPEDDAKFRSPTRSGGGGGLSGKEDKLSGTSSTMLRRPPFAPPPNQSSSSNKASDRASLAAAANLLYAGQNLTGFAHHNDSLGSSVTNSGVFPPGTSSLATGSYQSALGSTTPERLAGGTSGVNAVNSAAGTGAMSSRMPRSHLPPNKRAAAAATALAMSSGSSSCETAGGAMAIGQPTNLASPRLDVPASPKKLAHKGVQTPAYTCTECKEHETLRLTDLTEHKQALQELEDKLTDQFKEEKTSATQAALEQAQSGVRESIERERKITLDAAEARFAEILIQAKRRQWCRNCLSEAIYHCCWNTSYCSIPCQQEHWQNEHKRQCRRKRMLLAEHSRSETIGSAAKAIQGSDQITNDTEVKKPVRKALLEDTFDIAPTGLRFCFDRESFLHDDFQSDEFILSLERRGTSLEQIRDSLLQYSNILKSSLVELINEDYADFVNLSTNLVGLDKAIDSIASPLEQLRSAVLGVIRQLDSVEEELSVKLDSRQQLRNKKDLLNSLHTVGQCVTRLERWLASPVPTANAIASTQSRPSDEQSNPLDDDADHQEAELTEWPTEFYVDSSLHEDPGQRIDRIVNEYSKLQFFAKKCHDHPIVQCMKPRIQWITSILQEQLEARLKSALDAAQLTSSSASADDDKVVSVSKQAGEQLRQALSNYLIIDKVADLATLYRQYALRPKLAKIFTSRPELVSKGAAADKAVQVLQELYDTAQVVLNQQLGILRQLSLQRSPESYDPLVEFDCVVDGFLPETVDLLCDNLPDLFSPGDPDRFHRLYTISLSFLEQLERNTSQVEKLRNHPACGQFVHKWSLPVYFQIRFQDIAGHVEEAMHSNLAYAKENSEDCLLVVTHCVIQQLQRCWDDGIYLKSLRHRFFKLTLQLLSRYATFVRTQLTASKAHEKSNSESGTLNNTASTDHVDGLLHLLIDAHRLGAYAQHELPDRILHVTETAKSSESGSKPQWLTDCLDESIERLLMAVVPIGEVVLTHTKRACLSVSRQLLDVPRQYRRTNRSMPTSPSPNVMAMVAPLTRLAQLSIDKASNVPTGRDALAKLLCQCVDQVAEAYLEQLTELLNSVKKMEDSLQKLRQAKRGSNAISQPTRSGPGVYTDDDKIRHQLYLDACAFRDEIGKLSGVNDVSRANLQRIVTLTEAAKAEAAH